MRRKSPFARAIAKQLATPHGKAAAAASIALTDPAAARRLAAPALRGLRGMNHQVQWAIEDDVAAALQAAGVAEARTHVDAVITAISGGQPETFWYDAYTDLGNDKGRALVRAAAQALGLLNRKER